MAPAEVNSLEEEEFVARFGALFEHSPWVAERAWHRRPFSSIEDLHRAMTTEIYEAQFDEQIALLRAHPDTPADDSGKMAELGRAYRQRFGFPCIVAHALHDSREGVLREMEKRLGNEAVTEMRNGLEQLAHIARARLDKLSRPDVTPPE